MTKIQNSKQLFWSYLRFGYCNLEIICNLPARRLFGEVLVICYFRLARVSAHVIKSVPMLYKTLLRHQYGKDLQLQEQ